MNLKTLIESHEEWLTNRTIHYARQEFYTQHTSTLREAWRISVCGLSAPLIQLIETTDAVTESQETAVKQATEFGILQSSKHRALGIQVADFIGMLKLYRRAYMDLIAEKLEPKDNAEEYQTTILGLFDAMELGLLTEWTTSSTSDKLAELKESNRSLSNEKNKYMTVFESIAEPAILLDKNDLPTHFNSATNHLLFEDDQPGAGYYGQPDTPIIRELVSKILDAKHTDSELITVQTPSGSRTLSFSVQQLLDISKKFAGQVIILQDVTEFLETIEAAQSADRAKSIFLTTLSHEIRTPISNILGLTKLLEKDGLPAQKMKQLRKIQASGEMLSALTENVLGLSRAEANALQMVKQDFNLNELCEHLFQVLALDDTGDTITLEKRIEADVPLQLHGDAHKLRHILLNLLTNAQKNTHSGSVKLAITMDGDSSATQPTVRFDVIDTGSGVLEDDIETLFEPFVQSLHGSATTVLRGNGLGLAICKHLTDFLGGDISYRPNQNGGSIFSITLTFDLAKNPAPITIDATGLTVLVIEDDPVNAIVIEGYLIELGNDVMAVASYQQAVDALESSDFDIVITDYRLGDKTGLDIARMVKKFNQRKAIHIPIMVVTAAIPDNASQQLEEADVNLFLEKPFTKAELSSAISSLKDASHTVQNKTQDNAQKVNIKKRLNQLLTDLGLARCRAVVQSYQSNMPSSISGMQLCLAQENYSRLAELSHQLISASGFVGADLMVRLAQQLEEACESANAVTAQSKFSELLKESEITMQNLNACWQQIESTY